MNRPAVFLDLDDTVLDFHWAEHRALSAAFREVGLNPEQDLLNRYSIINRQQWELLEEGVLSREQVLLRRFEILFSERGIQASAAHMRDRYEQMLTEGYRFIPGAQEMLQSLQGLARLFLASNGCAAVQAARLKSAGLASTFEKIFISEELGADKPSSAFFERCFSLIPAFSRERAIMVGDSLTSDIRGGKNAGILTCWFNPKGCEPRPDIQPDYTISDLSELTPLVQRLFYRGDTDV